MMTPQERYARARALLIKLRQIDALRAEFLSFMRDLRLRKRDLEFLGGDQVAIWVRNCHDSAGDWLGAGFQLLCALGEDGLSSEELIRAIKLEDEGRSSLKFGLVMLDRERVAWLRRSRKAGITKLPAKHHPVARRVLKRWSDLRKLEKAESRQEGAVQKMRH